MHHPAAREKKQHSTTLIPYSYYECRLPEYFANVPMHWHNEFEIDYILRGSGEFICGDDKFAAREGDLVILPPNMLHAAYPNEACDLVYDAFVFHPAMLGMGSNDRCTAECIYPLINGNIRIQIPIRPGADTYPEFMKSADLIFSCAKANQPKQDLLLKSELLRLFWLLEMSDDVISRQGTEQSYSERIRPVLEYMSANFHEDLSIDQLAGLLHLSKSYFMSSFKNAVGVSAIEHLTQLRINAACEALSETDKMISDISLDCGYTNLSNFNRQFKKIVGCTPYEYRNGKKADRHRSMD